MGIDSKHRRRVLPSLLMSLAASMLVTSATAKPVIVLGDSIGVGISMAAKAPRLAHNSVTIRGDDIIQQIQRAPVDAIALVSLGTNDAVGSIAGVDHGIDRIVDAARRANVKLVWVGPPCVLKPWNKTATKLDAILRGRLRDKVAYVSIADQDVCARDLRAKDGVHFNMKGYAMLWERVQSAVDGGMDVAPEAALATTAPETPSLNRKNRRHKVASRNQDETAPETRSPSQERYAQDR